MNINIIDTKLFINKHENVTLLMKFCISIKLLVFLNMLNLNEIIR